MLHRIKNIKNQWQLSGGPFYRVPVNSLDHGVDLAIEHGAKKVEVYNADGELETVMERGTEVKRQHDLAARLVDNRLELAEAIRRRLGGHSVAVVLTAEEAKQVIVHLEKCWTSHTPS